MHAQVFSLALLAIRVAMYRLFVVRALCLLACYSKSSSSVHNSCASRYMDGDASDDVSSAPILARLREPFPRDEPAEKLDRLAEALERKPNRARRDFLQPLCSKAERDCDRIARR